MGLEPRWEGAGRFSGFGDVGRGIEAGFGRCGLEMDTEGTGGTKVLGRAVLAQGGEGAAAAMWFLDDQGGLVDGTSWSGYHAVGWT